MKKNCGKLENINQSNKNPHTQLQIQFLSFSFFLTFFLSFSSTVFILFCTFDLLILICNGALAESREKVEIQPHNYTICFDFHFSALSGKRRMENVEWKTSNGKRRIKKNVEWKTSNGKRPIVGLGQHCKIEYVDKNLSS